MGVIGLFVALSPDLLAQPPPIKGPIGPAGPVQQWPPQQAPQPNRNPTSIFPAFSGVFVIFLVIIAAQKKRQQEEEEEVTPTMMDPASGFEYKIVRSGVGVFKQPAKFRAMLEEEAQAGWEMFEKLDDARVRLRRLTSFRAQDADLTIDPYRTRYSGGEGKVVLTVLLVIGGVLGLIAAVVGILFAIK
jgi:hypothetical protein